MHEEQDEFFLHLHGVVLHLHKIFKFQKYPYRNDYKKICLLLI